MEAHIPTGSLENESEGAEGAVSLHLYQVEYTNNMSMILVKLLLIT